MPSNRRRHHHQRNQDLRSLVAPEYRHHALVLEELPDKAALEHPMALVARVNSRCSASNPK
jgi:hypothetical protein